jgi:hypothetical protein
MAMARSLDLVRAPDLDDLDLGARIAGGAFDDADRAAERGALRVSSGPFH